MSNPTCSAASLIENFPCLSPGVISERQQQLIDIWFLAKELATLGGTDYTAVLDTTLVADATTLCYKMNPSQIKTANFIIDRNNAVAAGATISSDTSALLASVAPISKYQNLDWLLLLLKCKLGVHKTFPQ